MNEAVRMKRMALTAALLLTTVALTINAHDLFLKFDSYFVPPNTKATVRLLNGTFRISENPVARDRMVDVSIVGPAGSRTNPPLANWRDVGATAVLDLLTSESATYLIGLYTKTRELTLNGNEFNEYLAHDGIPDTLAERKRQRQLAKSARERYSKYAKALFQVGDLRTETYRIALGYAVEIIPQENPYLLKKGDTLEVLCLKEGKPIANQYLLAGTDGAGRAVVRTSTRANESGIARIPLKAAGRWYVKFIHMTRLTDDPELDYESKWASLTFEIR